VRWVVVASLLAGCYPVEGNECDPGPFWDGPYFGNPHVASTGERMVVVWDEVTLDGSGTFRGAMTDGVTSDEPFDYEPGREPGDALSGPDRALVTGSIGDGRSFYELRLPSGQRVAPPVELAGFTGTCTFDGDAFLIARPGGLVRIALDGTAGPLIAIDDVGECAATATVTWVLNGGSDEPILGRRIARGGGVIDASPRLILDGSYFWVAAARSNQTVIVSEDRENQRTFVVVRDDGSVATRPLAIDVPFSRPAVLVAERDSYLLILEGSGQLVAHGVRLTPEGNVLGAPFVLVDPIRGNTIAAARTGDATTVVYDELANRDGPPKLDSIRIDDGQPPRDVASVASVEGELYTVDCGCQTGRGAGGLVGLIVLLLCGSRRHARGTRSPAT